MIKKFWLSWFYIKINIYIKTKVSFDFSDKNEIRQKFENTHIFY